VFAHSAVSTRQNRHVGEQLYRRRVLVHGEHVVCEPGGRAGSHVERQLRRDFTWQRCGICLRPAGGCSDWHCSGSRFDISYHSRKDLKAVSLAVIAQGFLIVNARFALQDDG